MNKMYLVKKLYVVKLSKVTNIKFPQMFKKVISYCDIDDIYNVKASGERHFSLISQHGVKVLKNNYYTQQIAEVFVSSQTPLCFSTLGKNKKYISLSEIKAFESSENNKEQKEKNICSIYPIK